MQSCLIMNLSESSTPTSGMEFKEQILVLPIPKHETLEIIYGHSQTSSLGPLSPSFPLLLKAT